ncbi:MAG TPA: hypothetical protein VFK52_13100 [Nocardioidaceae bacterium]|nr:hypothetical protein [Nocardioidaceae bacterium]
MAELPLVLVGPLLRRVDARRVCVFMALSKPGDVTVTVFTGRATSTGDGTANMPTAGTQTRPTRQVGANLHAIAVDVEVVGLNPLTRYSYDVVVNAGGQSKGLKALGMLKDGTGSPKPLALGYATDVLPSFVTPPGDLESLRIVHASCRKSNGPGADALAWLDTRIKDGLSNLDIAPQQLYLTGDQIYADDVGGVLLPMLADLGKDIIGTEMLSVGNGNLEATIANFPALRRQGTVRKLGRLTTTDGANHLLTYGEFVAMYCAAFSPTVWRPLPTADSLYQPPPGNAAATFATAWENAFAGSTAAWKATTKEGYAGLAAVSEEAKRVESWRDAVPKVARALANVPTYMIFDDHEITDDWNITDRWRRNVVSTRFGRAILRNGLMAYTVFQAWGNEPLRFLHNNVLDAQGNPVVVTEAQRSPEDKLLDRIKEVAAEVGAPTGPTYDKIDEQLGIDKPASAPKVQFHYQVPGPLFSVRVLDTRTRRTFKANDRHAPPKLLGDSMDSQVPAGPLTDGRELLIVIAPAPVLFPRLLESVGQPVAGLVFDLKTHMFGREDDTDPSKVPGLTGAEHKDIEGWRAVEEHHEAFLRRLGTYRRVVVLSGDVHFASTLTLDFWGKNDDTLDSRIVQCTASAARNQPGATERGLLRTLRLGQQLLRGTPAERLGWEGDHGVVLPAGAQIRPGRRARLRRKPAILPAQGWPGGTTVNGSPDWRWRLEVVRDDRPRSQLPAGAPEVPDLGWNAGDTLAAIAEIAGKHQQVALDPKDPVRLMVFRNNVGLVSFAKDGSDYRVSHTLLSTADEDTGDAFTQHTVPFAPSPLPAAPILRTV